MMRSVVYEENGPSSVLHSVDREPDEPGVGEVRVRVVVSAVNPTDWQARRGLMRPVATRSVPHQDGAGVVDAVGADVTEYVPGDRVWVDLAAFGRPLGGTAQEYTVLPLSRVHPLPAEASFDTGAILGVAGVTAHRALTVTEGWPDTLTPGALAGATVLVAGGAGAVGNAAIQLARWAGATIIATVSGPAKEELASLAGADHVLDYHDSDLVQQIRNVAPAGVNTIVDVAAGSNAPVNARVLASGGAIISYANAPGEVLEADMLALMNLNARMQFIRLFAIPSPAFASAITSITNAAATGALQAGTARGLPAHRFDLDHTAHAHDAVENGLVGKALIDVTGR